MALLGPMASVNLGFDTKSFSDSVQNKDSTSPFEKRKSVISSGKYGGGSNRRISSFESNSVR